MTKINEEMAMEMIIKAENGDFGDAVDEIDSDIFGEDGSARDEMIKVGEDHFFLDVNLDPEAYGFENDWATGPCLIGASGGNSTRTCLYLTNAQVKELYA